MQMPTDDEFDELLRKVGAKFEVARKARRYSLREAATKAGIADATWRRVETGFIKTKLGRLAYRPSADTVMAMAKVVGIDGAVICRQLGLQAPLQDPEPTPTTADLKAELEELRGRLDEVIRHLDR